MESKVVWQDGMSFAAHLNGFNFTIDADAKFGGQNKGPQPKGLTLTSLAGCTAMDVISILTKMRVDVEHFEVGIEGELAQEHPKKFTDIVIKYRFKGKDLPLDKIDRAIELSLENYCGVSATLKPVVNISKEIYINDRKVED